MGCQKYDGNRKQREAGRAGEEILSKQCHVHWKGSRNCQAEYPAETKQRGDSELTLAGGLCLLAGVARHQHSHTLRIGLYDTNWHHRSGRQSMFNNLAF